MENSEQKEVKTTTDKLSYGIVNQAIKDKKIDVSKVSDGYHTFSELYQHRAILFIALCKELYNNPEYQTGQKSYVWKSVRHSDEKLIEEGWFILGIGEKEGEQITYHLPMCYWEKTSFANTLIKAPKFDRHNADDVLKRLLDL